MALTFVGGNTGTWAGATSGTNTVSLTALTGGSASSAAAGDLVIAVYATGSAADRALTITDGTTAYTLLGTELYANGTSYDTNLRVAYKRLTAADTSVTFGATGNAQDAGAAAVYVWRGTDANSPFDATATTATGTGTGRPNPASITPVTSGAVIVLAGGGAAATGAVYTASYLTSFRSATSVDTNDAMVGVGYITWTSGAYDGAAWTGGTANSTDSWAAVSLALRPASNPSGSLSVSEETTQDTFTSSGIVTVKGALTVSETGEDTFSASGTVKTITNGTMSPHETGADTFTSTGKIIVQGSLSKSETGSDSFDSQGTVSSTLVGDLHATETGSDTATISGQVVVKGSLSVTENNDSFASTGQVLVKGSFTVSETGADAFDCQGTVSQVIIGDLHATESGDDIFATQGTEGEAGTLQAYETGEDQFEASGETFVTGTFAATEVADTFFAEGYPWFEYPLPETVMAGIHYGPDGSYVGTYLGGGGTRIEINSGKIVKMVGSTGCLLLD